ncbi:MAG: protein-L-isoaspartate(D-aspartate) O-methyltransferase [Clostridia bacterium]|nr:protein-L-isoaspartate(D-aspartate) O-methyltransferase [Clostridia bacterium]
MLRKNLEEAMEIDFSKNNELYNFFKELDRSIFIDNEYKDIAHHDSALPIGHEQTISQPSLVYGMTEKLKLDKSLKVLEIGTGSGYQTTFLAEFAGEVCTVERIDDLSKKAQKRLAKLGYKNVRFKIGDGSEGWAEFAPYDRIIVTAAAGKVPEPLVEQLKPGGWLLIPTGEQGLQDLLMIKKDEQGKVKEQSLGKVIFVELKGKYGWAH